MDKLAINFIEIQEFNMNDISLPIQFINILKLCEQEQGAKLEQVRNYILNDGRAKEDCNTRWMKYGRKSDPCIEIRFKDDWKNPKILMKLPRIDDLKKFTLKRCRYGLSIQPDGNYENFLEIYQVKKLKFERKLPIDTIINSSAVNDNDFINRNDKDKLIILLDLALNLDKSLSSFPPKSS